MYSTLVLWFKIGLSLCLVFEFKVSRRASKGFTIFTWGSFIRPLEFTCANSLVGHTMIFGVLVPSSQDKKKKKKIGHHMAQLHLGQKTKMYISPLSLT
jgi:hypothetical protein